MVRTPIRWHRPRGGSALVLAIGFVSLAVGLMAVSRRHRGADHRAVTLTAGPLDTTRATVARILAVEVTAGGTPARVVDTPAAAASLKHLEDGRIDFALVSAAADFAPYPRTREVAPLYMEALQLLVRPALADEVGRHLGGLRGHTIDLGPRGSVSAKLAAGILAFAGLPAGSFGAQNLELHDLEALAGQPGAPGLPDAVFHLSTVPSKVAIRLIHEAGYRLIAIPFADAFRLGAVVAEEAETMRQEVHDTVIPPFTYGTDPAIPAEPLHTIGTRLLLVAGERVPEDTVEVVLDAVFGSRFSRLAHPQLDRAVLALPPRIAQHAGTLAYLRRNRPFVTNETVSQLSGTLSIFGALVGGSLALLQWLRRRSEAAREEIFGGYMVRIAGVERRVARHELAATLELEPLVTLQREMLELKDEALAHFTEGDLAPAALSGLLGPMNATADRIGELMLHVRSHLEDRADTEGRSAQALWTEAVDKPGTTEESEDATD